MSMKKGDRAADRREAETDRGEIWNPAPDDVVIGNEGEPPAKSTGGTASGKAATDKNA